jgi:hypothetical protein
VLEYLPPQAPDRYRVRQLDLATGTVTGIGSRQKVAVPEEEMRGSRRMGVFSPDYRTLYTLYIHQPDHLHSRDLLAGVRQSSGDVHAFVHVLSLADGWAFCLDLPRPFGLGPATAHALAVSPSGRWLYVADRSSGGLVMADTTDLVIRSNVDIGADEDAASVRAAAEVGPDGSVFVTDTGEILVVGPTPWSGQRVLRLTQTPLALALSGDGERLFVGVRDQVLRLDARTGAQLGSVATVGAEHLQLVPSPSANR